MTHTRPDWKDLARELGVDKPAKGSAMEAEMKHRKLKLTDEDRIDLTPPPPEALAFEHNGLPCRAVRTDMGHWCGYVGVPEGHPWHGKGYSDRVSVPKSVVERPVSVDDIGAIPLFCSDVSDYGETGTIDLCLAVDVHGGLTYARAYPGGGNANGATWWLGFDCAHCDDDPSVQDGDYTEAQCRRLADQVVAFGSATGGEHPND